MPGNAIHLEPSYLGISLAVTAGNVIVLGNAIHLEPSYLLMRLAVTAGSVIVPGNGTHLEPSYLGISLAITAANDIAMGWECNLSLTILLCIKAKPSCKTHDKLLHPILNHHPA